ncbi:MAG: endolytic transglycosylase MltG [Acidimicrobiales bacterium]
MARRPASHMTGPMAVDDLDERPPSRHRMLVTVVGGFGALVLVVLVWVVAWYELQVHAGPPGRAVVVDVAPGSGAGQVATSLAHSGVISSSLALRVYFTFHGTPTIGAGEYSIPRGESFDAVERALSAGPNVVVNLPGFTVYELAQQLGEYRGHSASGIMQLVQSRAVTSPYEAPGTGNLDGLLGVGLYVLRPGESDQTLIEQMVERFDAQAQQVGLVAQAAKLGITPYQAVIVASIVQKEGVYPENIAKVARVVYNRLAARMPLQMNSTVLYAEHRDGGPVTASDLALDTPYNTYKYPGLTPTPIAFVSTACFEAALNPAPGQWLYFVVVSKDGTEAFADTYAEQLANEQLAASRGVG